jgi:stage V sporulation protein G
MQKTTKATAPTAATKPNEAQAASAYPMKYDVKINSIRPEGNPKAIASVNINDSFAIRSVKIMEGSNGLFVSMPSYKAGNGEYKDICFPCTKEAREQFNDAVIDAYQQALAQGQTAGQKQAAAPFVQPEQNSGPKMTM